MLHSTVIVIVHTCKLWQQYTEILVLYFPEPGSLILFSHLQALLNGENHFCYLASNSVKGESVVQLNLLYHDCDFLTANYFKIMLLL